MEWVQSQTPSVSAPPPGTVVPGTHASLEPARKDERMREMGGKWDGKGDVYV